MLALGAILPLAAFAAARVGPALSNQSAQPPAIPLAYPDAITGVVYRDYDADGVRDSREPGVANITVTAYISTGVAITSATTEADGSYTLNIPANTSVRLEFTGLPDYLQPGPAGPNSATTVAFVDVGGAGTTVVDVGLNNPSQYCESNPDLAVSCFIEADNSTSNLPVVVTYPYTSNTSTPMETPLAQANQVGTVYGLAYHAASGTLFGSSYIKRGAGLGSANSTGAIYRITGTGAPSPFIDLNATGVISAGPNPHPNGVAGYNWITDTPAFTNVGKVGLGDLDISEDGQNLYTVNLFERELVILPLTYDLNGDPVAPAAGDILTRPIPVHASCDGDGVSAPSADDARPFGLKYFDGLLYVGVVCSAQTMLENLSPAPTNIAALAAVRAAMRAYVYVFDPATNTFDPNPILNFRLDYPRQQVNDGFPTAPANDGEWLPWTDVWRPAYAPFRITGTIQANPQPMLTDIEFDGFGFMTLGFRDRFADQSYDRGDPGPFNGTTINTRQGGDLLLACLDGAGNWQLEGSGTCTNGLTGETRTASILRPDSGPDIPGPPANFFEFYHDDRWFSFHDETALGALAHLPGSGEMVFTKYDTWGTFEAGTWTVNNSNGNLIRRARVYVSPNPATSPTFGKGGGLGDLELICQAAPIEIGNRVWLDSNANGIQDPGETPLQGVEVVLYLSGAPVATATTDVDGNYYFIGSDNPIAPTVGSNYGIAPAIIANTDYEIRIALSQTVVSTYSLTLADRGTDLRDSDGVRNGAFAVISLTTGPAGYNNHTYDFGFVDGLSLGDTVWRDVDNDGVLDAGENGIAGVELRLFRSGDNPLVATPVATTTTDANGNYIFLGLAPGDYFVYIPASEFGPGQPLYLLNSSTGNGSAPDPDDDVNNDDNGDADGNGGVISLEVTLAAATEPTDDGDLNSYSNLTLDFGFIRPPSDYGDLPDGPYNTDSLGPVAGPSHVITTSLQMGTAIDDEGDGQPSPDADGDDINGNDEDGVTLPGTIVAGQTSVITVTVTNATGSAAVVYGFVDWNGDGDFDDTNEVVTQTVADGALDQPVALNFTVPLTASTGADLGARFRLSTDTGLGPDGPAPDGEVEDYLVRVIGLDYGDLPDGPYNTDSLGVDGPSHVITSSLRLGADEDAEGDGQPNSTATGDDAAGTDDEDGVTLPGMIVAGQMSVITVTVTNNTGSEAVVYGFVDWNGDGDFDDANEVVTQTVADGTLDQPVALNFTVPLTANTGADLGARFRLSTDTGLGPDGPAPDGEVEDYLVRVIELDYGDLPQGPYNTTAGSGGPSHVITDSLRMGATIDEEGNGQPNSTATGDDANGVDDEDGVTLPGTIVAGQTNVITVTVTNNTGSDAVVYGFVDWNGDGDFDDANEVVTQTVGDGAVDQPVALNFAVPLTASTEADLGARFRLSTDTGLGPDGPAPDGEVEDYLVRVIGLDYGDLPDGPYNTDNVGLVAGPSHVITSSLRLGADEDAEGDGQSNGTATGDDANGVDDEDGVTLPGMIVAGQMSVITVTVTNNTGGDAVVYGFVDWNGDGDFDDTNEVVTQTVVDGAVNQPVSLSFAVPLTASTGLDLGARFRLSTDTDLGPDGPAPDGEVEDYLVRVVALDYGDLPEGPYNTTEASGGPSHVITNSLQIGGTIDEEGNGQPSPDADGDDVNGVDDEDGVTLPGTIVAGQTNVITVTVTNNTGSAAVVYGFVDWNADGDFDDANEVVTQTVADGALDQPVALNFTVPLTASTGANLGARFRLSTDTGLGPDGPAPDGEVEDYLVRVVALDYGDLPEGPYNTTEASGGPSHVITNSLQIGGTIDEEGNGQPGPDADGDDVNGVDDEDGVTLPGTIVAGQTNVITVTVTNNTGSEAVVYGFVDWNGDGDFDDTNEVVTQTVADGALDQPVALNFTVPLTASTGMDLGARFRLSTDTGLGPDGPAPDGEVEDYLVRVIELDYGDLPQGPYNTTAGSGGPSHVITSSLRLGADEDAEGDGQPNSTATGDDVNGDDEDGVTLPGTIVAGQTNVITVTVTNNTGSEAVVYGFVDWNGDGDFDDANEVVTQTVADGALNQPVALNFTVPLTANTGADLGARFRLSTDTGLGPDGAAPDGEVEDYLVRVIELDYGDLPQGPYNTTAGSGGPSHVITDSLQIGATIDEEGNGQPNSTATGDDANGVDDEDGVTLPGTIVAGQMSVITVTVTNNTGSDAVVYGFVDWNGDGDFDDTNEVVTQTVADGALDQPVALNFTVPLTANTGADLGARFRLSTDTGLGPDGPAPDGEVEDYLVRVIGLDYGDLPDGPYNTDSLGVDGPSHVITTSLQMGATIDAEDDGQPSANADGDDTNGVDDEDGVILPTIIVPGQTTSFEVTVTNNTGSEAVVYGFVDWNGDGDFGDADEVVTQTVADGTTNGVVTLNFNVPLTANTGVDLGARFRLSTDTGLGPDGPAPDGEVEDYEVTIQPLLSLGNRVWDDANNNGLDDNEAGIDGVVLQLLDGGGNPVNNPATGQPYTTTTAAGGYYTFTNLISGTYRVRVLGSNFNPGNALEGYISSSDVIGSANPNTNTDGDDNGPGTAGSGDIISGIVTLSYNSEPIGEALPGGGVDNDTNTNFTVDFGFTLSASLGDYVWVDSDGDGQQDGSEVGLNGVTVNLWADTDNDNIPDTVISTTTTITNAGQAGYYNFPNLVPSLAYLVEFVPPPDYFFTTPDTVGDTVDSDANPSNGRSPVVFLNPNENNPTLDAGLYRTQLEIAKVANVTLTAPGQEIIYTITVTNRSDIILNPVVVTDTMDAGLVFLGAIPTPDDASGPIIWNDVTGGAGLAPGAQTSITVRASATLTGSLNNIAATSGNHPMGVTPPVDDNATVIIQDPSVSLNKETVPPGMVGGIITFTIRITNAGPSTLDEIALIDTFSGPVEYIGGTPLANTIDNVNRLLSWNNLAGPAPNGFGQALDPGESYLVTTVFRLTSGLPSFSMSNRATTTGVEDVFDNAAADATDVVDVINEPTAVDLLYFTARQQGSEIHLSWATFAEYNNFGFRLLRSTTGELADATEIAFVPGEGSSTTGATYAYIDQAVLPGLTFTYWLVDVDFDGRETYHLPPRTVTFGKPSSTTTYLPYISKD
jgi:uncharacterized repeat protein (TIGR01451 family)